MTEARSGAGAVRIPGWLVVLGRQAEMPGDHRVRAFAEAFRIDEFTARQRLVAPCARILRREPDEPAAREWLEWLRALDFTSFIVQEGSLANQSYREFIAVFVEGDVLVLDDARGGRVELPTESVACLVSGEVKESRITEHVRPGLMWDEERPEERTPLRAEIVIDIHRRDSLSTPRLRQNSFLFSRVFPEGGGGSLPLMRRLLDKLHKRVPHAPMYDEFDAAQGVLGDSLQMLSSETKVVLNWRRVGRTIQAEHQRDLLDSNAPIFDLYSSLARFEVLK